MSINPILARFQDEPSLLGENTRAWFESCVQGAAAKMAEAKLEMSDQMADGFWFGEDDYRSRYQPYNVSGGVLQIPVKGALLGGFPYAIGYATGYEYIHAAMKRGMDDPDVQGIALVIDSPGGMVAGNFDLVDRMHAMRGRKPVKAFAAESAYSAAYSIASAADEIVVTRSGGVGSVGVVTMHVDYSEALANAGVKITYIFAGKHKVEGNPYEALPEAARARLQERIDALYTEFVALVARNRGMDEKAVRKTEALTYSAADALDVGFADRIGALDDEITAFTATFNEEEDRPMAVEPKAGITEEALATAVASATQAGRVDGTTEAMTRINAIVDSEAGKKRPAAALNAALKTSMSAEEATGFLAMLPEEGKPEAVAPAPAPVGAGAPKGMLDAAMDASGNPIITTDAPAEKTKQQMDSELRAAFNLPGFV